MVALLLTASGPAQAQFLARPFLDWRTVETEHFAFHFPRELEDWTLDVAARIESVRSAVGSLVGNVPRRRVQVVVDDPYNLSNGFAIPPLDWPIIVLWATPPSPRAEVGHFREWGAILTIHEFAHVAHLTWPSRNPFQRRLWRFLPAELGPVLRRSPTWVIEGYATYVEGRVTGGGRPHSVWRPAILRQWALEGRLPTYAQLNGSDTYRGRAFPYLVGSAYLEWLAQRQGDSSLVYLWRRLSARRNRTFTGAFAGLFGDRPDVLYGRFVAELTGSALAVERLINDAGGVVAGDIVQRLEWETGDPAISRDGRQAAIELRAERRPPRLVVWMTGPDSVPPTRRRRPARRPAPPRDTLDVPDRTFYPRAKRAVATLRSADGRAYEDPRFFADGERLLVSRLEPRGDGSLVYDLSVWNYRRRTVRRITRGASVQAADPSPDGRAAAGTRCAGARCDLVSVDLATGRVTTLLAATPDVSFYRPRYSPDGRRIAVSVHRQGQWRIGIVDIADRMLRFVGPDDGAARYEAAWLPGDRGLVWVSQNGGVPNVETFDLRSGVARSLTRVTGAAVAPEPNPADGSIWFLSLHARGLDVRRIVPDSVRVDPPIELPQRLAPSVPGRPSVVPDTLRTRGLARSHSYGLGPRQLRWFPGFAAGADGAGGEIVLSNADPVGRLAVRAGGSLGEPSVWRGGSLDLTWGGRAGIATRAYVAQQQPSRRFVGAPGRELDVRVTGGDVGVDLVRDYWSVQHRYRAGGSLARVDPVDQSASAPRASRTRGLGYAELRASARQRHGELRLAQSLAAHADAGGIGSDQFVRGLISAGVAVGGPLLFGGVQAAATYGEISGTRDPFERFIIGGAQPPLFDDAVLPQRIVMPALPTGVGTGDRMFAFRVALPTGPLWPYYWGASAANRGERLARWHRVVGWELRLTSDAIPLVALPEVQLVAGYGRSLDQPYRKGQRVYATLTYRR